MGGYFTGKNDARSQAIREIPPAKVIWYKKSRSWVCKPVFNHCSLEQQVKVREGSKSSHGSLTSRARSMDLVPRNNLKVRKLIFKAYSKINRKKTTASRGFSPHTLTGMDVALNRLWDLCTWESCALCWARLPSFSIPAWLWLHTSSWAWGESPWERDFWKG